VEPTCTEPKLLLVGLAAKVPAVVAVPVSPTLRVGFDPLSVKARFPVTVPVVCGT
jgi:hypothetical protein